VCISAEHYGLRSRTINHQSYFICQHEELHTINYNCVNISTCGRLPKKLQSSSSWSPIVTMRMHTVLINHAHTHTHTHTQNKKKIKKKIFKKMQNIAQLYKNNEKPTSSSSFTSNICEKSTIS